jgi:hypothetical protein
MLPTNFAAPSARPGPAKETVDAARAIVAALATDESMFFMIHILEYLFNKADSLANPQ